MSLLIFHVNLWRLQQRERLLLPVHKVSSCALTSVMPLPVTEFTGFSDALCTRCLLLIRCSINLSTRWALVKRDEPNIKFMLFFFKCLLSVYTESISPQQRFAFQVNQSYITSASLRSNNSLQIAAEMRDW